MSLPAAGAFLYIQNFLISFICIYIYLSIYISNYYIYLFIYLSIYQSISLPQVPDQQEGPEDQERRGG